MASRTQIVMTYELAMAASRDHANALMRKRIGRSPKSKPRWTREEYNAAVEKFHRLYPCPDPRCEICAPHGLRPISEVA